MMGRMNVADRLRDEGYRLTPQRQLVWEVLRTATAHLAVEEIHAEVSRTVADFNLASVYRTLTLLGELGLARQVQLGDGRGYWEVAHPDDEFHLHCTTCRSVTHHHSPVIEEIRVHLAAEHDFTTGTVDLVVHGRCTTCRAAEANDPG
jgi:Fe2+ or Zn2+ uptake regulation protein